MSFLRKNYPAILLAILSLALFSRILFSSKLFPGFDPLLIFYPYSFNFLHLQSFWTSGILSGFNAGTTPNAFAGNWIYYFFASDIGFKFFDFITFYNVLIFFYFILIVLFSYLAARMLGFDKWVSTLIASVYIFSAYNLSWMVNIVTAASLFVFPALIYFLLKFKEYRNWIWPFLGGLALGFGLIMAHPQLALIAIFGGFLFSLFLTFESDFKKPKWIFLVAFLAISLIGLALAAFQLIPEYQTVLLTQRGEALSFSASQECALIPLDFVRYFIPNFNFLVSCESLLYVGILPLILAILAIFYAKSDRKRVLFWAFLFVFAILFSIKYSPLAWLFHQLPIWGSLRGPARFVMLGNFSLAVLAGHGFMFLLENKEKFKEFKIFRWIKRIFFGGLAMILIINIAGFFKQIFIKLATDYFDKYYYQKTIGLPIENYHRSIENLISSNFYSFSFLNKDFAIPFILIIVAFLVLFFIYKFNKKTLFCAVIFSGFIWAISSPMISSGLTRDFFRETEVVEFLKDKKSPFRIYSLLPSLSTYQLLVSTYSGVTESDQNEFFKTMLPPNLNIIYGLNSIDGYDASMPRRTARLLAELLSERATVGNKIAEARLKPEEKIKIFESRKNLLSMMNVKYVISAYPLDEKIFKKVFKEEITRFKIPVYIYENENILPRFYVVNKAEFGAADEIKSLEKILDPDFDFKAETLIECERLRDCGQTAGRGKITDFEYKDGYLKLNAEFDASGWFVFGESYDNNWQVLINGAEGFIYRANYIYQAVQIPAGKNTIEFIYKP